MTGDAVVVAIDHGLHPGSDDDFGDGASADEAAAARESA